MRPVQYMYGNLSLIRCVFCFKQCSLLFIYLPGHCGVGNNAENIASRLEAKNNRVAPTENGTHKNSYLLPTRFFNFIVTFSGFPKHRRALRN